MKPKKATEKNLRGSRVVSPKSRSLEEETHKTLSLSLIFDQLVPRLIQTVAKRRLIAA